jgi:hypothetical protein
MENINIGKAVFNLQRFQILQTKINPQTADKMPDFYAYAWSVKMFPFLDEGGLHEDLKEFFTVTESQANLVSDRADSEWLEKRLYNFYEYEDYFNVRSNPVDGLDRWKLISIFRYSYLRRGFDESFWKKLLEPMKHPTEASIITSDFKREDLYFI